MGVFVLAELRVGRGDADISGQIQFVTKIPRVAVHGNHEWLRPMGCRVTQWIDDGHARQRALAGDEGGL